MCFDLVLDNADCQLPFNFSLDVCVCVWGGGGGGGVGSGGWLYFLSTNNRMTVTSSILTGKSW